MARRRRTAMGLATSARSTKLIRSGRSLRASEIGIPPQRRLQRRDAISAIGYYQLTTRRGVRCSTRPSAYLAPCAHRAREPRAAPTARATRMRLSNGRRATGVAYRPAGRVSLPARSHAKCILRGRARCSRRNCCTSPGVGDRVIASGRFEIPIVHALRRRRREPAGPPAGACHLPLHETDHDQRYPLKSWPRQLLMGLHSTPWRGTGPMAVGINRGGTLRPHRIAAPATARRPVPRRDTALPDMAGLAACTISPGSRCRSASLRRQSRGCTCAEVAGPACAAPAMQPNYLSTDRRIAQRSIAGIRLARQASPRRARSRPMSPANTDQVPTPASDDELLEFARNTGRHDLPSVRARAGWDRPHDRSGWPSSTHELSRVVTASPEFASSTAASCRRSFPATPTRRPVMIAEKHRPICVVGRMAPRPEPRLCDNRPR